ncbi:SubName: Full=Uncharacterized protein {ECO:0000313/EMBL:CCA74385.1} [Serendipita indica DSM 11827]|nr:SubName: Full=Uncharacterized protein {ECO:0000313/EMBL:CCA74385.1} [Serendipita indica DSM 11827]
MHPFDSVDTNIDFNQAKEEDAFAQPLFAYPFDVWQGSIVFAITDRVVSDRLNLTNNHILNPGELYCATAPVINWRIQLAANNADLARSMLAASCTWILRAVDPRSSNSPPFSPS